MGLIKSSNLRSQPGAFSLADVEKRAEMLVEQARARADQLLAEARQQAQEIARVAAAAAEADARKKGFEAGLAEGRKKGEQQALAEHRAKLEAAAKAFAAAAQTVDSQLGTVIEQARIGLLELSVAIARRVVRRLGAFDAAVVEETFVQAIDLLQQKSRAQVRVHPTQVDQIEQLLPQLKVKWPALLHVEVVADSSILPGGCVVSGGSGRIDADLDSQVDRIAQILVPDRPVAAEEVRR